MNHSLRHAAFYLIVATVVLAYVAVVSGAFGSFTTPLDDRGAPQDQLQQQPPSHLSARLTITAVVLAVWILCDYLEIRFLRRADAFARALIRVLTGWAFFLALGASISPGNHRLLAGGIVLAVTALFLGLWLSALATRGRNASQGEPN